MSDSLHAKRRLMDRYLAGEFEPVWEELVMLGASWRNSLFREEAVAVAAETMRRVRLNLATVRGRLESIGYEFASPSHALRDPAPEDRAALVELERVLGPLPLSLRAFYEVVGRIDFRQSPRQRRNRSDDERLSLLGREDPLVVFPPGALLDDCVGYRDAFDSGRIAKAAAGRITTIFAPDEFHKDGCSGGENYVVALPCDEPDFFVTGLYGIEETFVQHLRRSLQGGGFRGESQLDPEDESRPPTKTPPDGALIERITAGLLPF